MFIIRRVYRSLAACLVVVLLAGVCMPLVQHVCAMAKRTMTHHAHAQSPSHHPTHEHHPLADDQPDEGCADEALPRALPEGCCVVKTAVGIGVKGPTPPVPSRAVAVWLGAVPVLASIAGLTHSVSARDTGPPPSCGLHILYASFLN